MKIKSFLPSKIVACLMSFMFCAVGIYLYVDLKFEKYEAIIFICFLYGIIFLNLTVIVYNFRRVFCCQEKCTIYFGKYAKTISWDEFEVREVNQFGKGTWHAVYFALYPNINKQTMSYFHQFTLIMISLENGAYWADGLFMKGEELIPILEEYGVLFTDKK